MAHSLVDWGVGDAAAAFPARTDITTNGDFAVGTGWTLGTGATIGGGVLSYDGTQASALSVTQTPSTALLTDRPITCKFTVSNWVAGNVRVIAGDAFGPWVAADGVYTHLLRAKSGTLIGVEGDVNFDGDIDDLQHLQWRGIYGHYNAKGATAYSFDRVPGGNSNQIVSKSWTSNNSQAHDPFAFNGGAEAWDRDTDVSGPVEPVAGAGGYTFHIADTQHQDYHFRIWVIPKSLQLSNPVIGADIPFRLWNTFPVPNLLSSTVVVGSNVLTFDVVDGVTSILDQQYLEVDMQIGAGEPTVEAEITFTFAFGSGVLNVIAVVSETFNILPEVPVHETLSYRTDVLRAYDSTEKRLSLMPEPRTELNMKVTVVDFGERRDLYELTQANIKVASLVPMFQYAAPVTTTTAVGASRFFFDPKLTNLRVNGFMMAMDRHTREIVLGRVTILHVDGCTVQSATGVEVSAPNWFIAPAISTMLQDNTGLDFGTQAGTFSLRATALEFPTLVRPGSAATITTFDSLPVLEYPFLITTPERWTMVRDKLDGGVGAVAFKTASLAPVMNRGLKFALERRPGDDFDYFREFIDGVKGAHKPFLITTRLPDLTLRNPVTQAASVIDINETFYEPKFFPHDAYKRIEVLYANGDNSYHTISSVIVDLNNDHTITITPALVDDPDYILIDRISYLHRVRGSDKIMLEHYNDYSYLKWNVRTVND